MPGGSSGSGTNSNKQELDTDDISSVNGSESPPHLAAKLASRQDEADVDAAPDVPSTVAAPDVPSTVAVVEATDLFFFNF